MFLKEKKSLINFWPLTNKPFFTGNWETFVMFTMKKIQFIDQKVIEKHSF